MQVSRLHGVRDEECALSHLADSPTSLPNAPFKHFIIGLPSQPSIEELQHKLAQLITLTRKGLEGLTEVPNYNVIIFREWMMVVPRTHKERNGVATNAVGMMGVVWVSNDDEMQTWIELGLTDHLRYLGIPA